MKLAAYGLSLEQVAAIANENITEPVRNVTSARADYTIRILGEFDDPALVGDVVVSDGGALVKLARSDAPRTDSRENAVVESNAPGA